MTAVPALAGTASTSSITLAASLAARRRGARESHDVDGPAPAIRGPGHHLRGQCVGRDRWLVGRPTPALKTIFGLDEPSGPGLGAEVGHDAAVANPEDVEALGAPSYAYICCACVRTGTERVGHTNAWDEPL